MTLTRLQLDDLKLRYAMRFVHGMDVDTLIDLATEYVMYNIKDDTEQQIREEIEEQYGLEECLDMVASVTADEVATTA